MSDDKATFDRRQPPDVEPRAHVDLGDAEDLRLWGLVLDVSPRAVLAAALEVGTNARDVQAEIDAKPEIYRTTAF